MARKKQQINTHFERLSVKALRLDWGAGVYNLSDFNLEATYRVLATYLKTWDDGSHTPVFLMEGPEGAIVERACSCFRIAEVT